MHFPDFNDIIFKGRNKEYGAYSLRRDYNKVVAYSVIIAVIIGSAIVLIPFFNNPEEKAERIYSSVFVTMENLKLPGPATGIPYLPPPPSRPHASSRSAAAELSYAAPKVVDSIPMIEKPVLSNADTTGIKSDGDGQGENDDLGDGTGNYTGGVEGGTGGGGGNGIYSEVEVMPRFKGGDINKFREWVQKKTKYTEDATTNGIQGKVYITFIVENDGTVSNVKVAKGVDPLIDDEAVKAVKSSPKWSPGRLQGIPVRVSYIIMLDFQL